jgi:hypothetical protein
MTPFRMMLKAPCDGGSYRALRERETGEHLDQSVLQAISGCTLIDMQVAHLPVVGLVKLGR